jgi:hypothetical protein
MIEFPMKFVKMLPLYWPKVEVVAVAVAVQVKVKVQVVLPRDFLSEMLHLGSRLLELPPQDNTRQPSPSSIYPPRCHLALLQTHNFSSPSLHLQTSTPIPLRIYTHFTASARRRVTQHA